MSEEKENIVVFGGTTNTGKEIVKALHEKSQEMKITLNISIIARSEKKAEKIKKKYPNVSIIQSEIENTEQLRESLKDVNKAFIVTGNVEDKAAEGLIIL